MMRAFVGARGFALLIAHPERAARFDPDGLRRIRPVLADGALLQVNACSLLGRNGPQAQATAQRLVRDRLAYVIASDGHGGARSDTLGAIGRSQLTEANPRFLLEHGIPAEPGHARAWRSLHEQRMRAAIVAARKLL